MDSLPVAISNVMEVSGMPPSIKMNLIVFGDDIAMVEEPAERAPRKPAAVTEAQSHESFLLHLTGSKGLYLVALRGFEPALPP